MAKNDLAMFKKVVAKQLGMDIFSYNKEVKRVTTSSLKLDDYIGGGIVEGKIVEIYGSESSGKSTLATLIGIQFQEAYPDKAIGILDLEHVWNHDYALAYGLSYDEDRLIFTQPSSAEEALNLAEKMLESGLFSVVILDSIAAMLTKRQLAGEVGDATIGEVARLMSANLPKLNTAASNTGTAMVFINQTRSNIGTFSPVPGGSSTTPGGKALKFFCSLRLEVKKRDFIVKGDDTIGQQMRFIIRKNKFGRNNGYVDANLYYNVGFKPEDEIVELCKSKGIIESRGAWVYYGDLKWNGVKALVDAVKADNELFQVLFLAYRNFQMSNEAVEIAVLVANMEGDSSDDTADDED